MTTQELELQRTLAKKIRKEYKKNADMAANVGPTCSLCGKNLEK